MAEYIEREALLYEMEDLKPINWTNSEAENRADIEYGVYREMIKLQPSADVVEVVRCRDCKFATELDVHCEFNRKAYKHCSLLRGDETRNVWHKHKKYYKDYSIVELDEFCSYGERKCEE